MLTYTSVIRLDSRFTPILTGMSLSAKAIYNSMLYASRQNYFNHTENEKSNSTIKFEKSFADFKSPDVYKYVKENINQYWLLPNSVSQNSCLSVMQDMRSFFGLVKLKNEGKYDKKVNIPHYKKRENLFSLMFSKGNISKIGRKVRLTTPKNLTYYDTFEEKEITITQNEKINFLLPEYLEEKDISYIEIIPSYGGFDANIVYKKEEEFVEVNPNKFMSIDLGINNFATTLSSDGEAIIYNGKGMKSANQFFNKIKAKLTSRKEKSKCEKEKNALKQQLFRISLDRKGYIKTQMATIGNEIIHQVCNKKISTIVVGLNQEWKQDCNMGKKNNQNFTNLAHSRFIEVLSYLAKAKGISVVTINESHTSKCDAMAKENISHQETYLGKRKYRGLFVSSVGQAINADVNGAWNILRRFLNVSRKSLKLQETVFTEILRSGRFQRPRVLSL